MTDKYKFTYFDGRARGEIIRYIFAQIDVPYVEVTITHAQWINEKQKYGKIPILEVNGKMLCQSTTIVRYLANKYGLSGKDEWTEACADMLLQTIEDIYVTYKDYIAACFKQDKSGIDAAKKVLVNDTFRPLFEKYEKILGNKKYFAGDQMTYADFAIAELADRIEQQFEKNFMDSYPNVKEHMIRIHQLPNIKKYVEKRPVAGFDG